MKNYSSVPRKSLLRVLATKAIVLIVDEYRTSKMCSKCGEELEEPKPEKIKKEKLKKMTILEEDKMKRLLTKWTKSDKWHVRCCENKSCVPYWSRDVNASVNILMIGFSLLTVGERPQYLDRKNFGGYANRNITIALS